MLLFIEQHLLFCLYQQLPVVRLAVKYFKGNTSWHLMFQLFDAWHLKAAHRPDFKLQFQLGGEKKNPHQVMSGCQSSVSPSWRREGNVSICDSHHKQEPVKEAA